MALEKFVGGNISDKSMNDSELNTPVYQNDSFLQYPEYEMGRSVFKYCSPVILVVGTLGNILSVIILLRRELRQCSTTIYLTTLGITDLVFLWTALLRNTLQYNFGISLRNLSEGVCQFDMFVTYFSKHYSAWILVAVSIERLIAVWHPFRAKQLCTKKTAIFSLVTMGVVLVGVDLHFIWTLSLDNIGNCTNRPQFQTFVVQIWIWIDGCIGSFIPFIIMIICNICIIAKVMHARSERVEMTNNSVINYRQSSMNSRRGDVCKFTSMTAMLLGISFGFIITTSPFSIYLLYYHSIDFNLRTEQNKAALFLAYSICGSIFYINSAINFLLYCITGRKFRRELCTICCAKCILSMRNVEGGAPDFLYSWIRMGSIKDHTGTTSWSSHNGAERDSKRYHIVSDNF
ncbi:unnamed protein product [Owenia fusiformis]|uniref:Uncharacterized protein n=1 Tax=Owenia fusiformis TaxID=6347 RepID=A0A8J1TAD7_OWEFU|nr:unnamed protein product [Owenia fusiformis]